MYHGLYLQDTLQIILAISRNENKNHKSKKTDGRLNLLNLGRFELQKQLFIRHDMYALLLTHNVSCALLSSVMACLLGAPLPAQSVLLSVSDRVNCD